MSHAREECRDDWCPEHTEQGRTLQERAVEFLRSQGETGVHVCNCVKCECGRGR